jgi:hypothetical protein
VEYFWGLNRRCKRWEVIHALYNSSSFSVGCGIWRAVAMNKSGSPTSVGETVGIGFVAVVVTLLLLGLSEAL